MSFPVVDSGVRPWVPSVVGGTGTVAKVFPALVYPNNGLNTASGASAQDGVYSATTGQSPLTCVCPANGQFEMQRFKVVASGKVFVHGTSPTLLWSMYSGTSMTAASDGTALLTMSALTGLTTNKTYPWSWTAEFQGDSTSGILQAISSTLWVNNATAGTITLTGIASGFNALAGGPTGIIGPGYTATSPGGSAALNLLIALTFGVSDATNSASCAQFVVEI